MTFYSQAFYSDTRISDVTEETAQFFLCVWHIQDCGRTASAIYESHHNTVFESVYEPLESRRSWTVWKQCSAGGQTRGTLAGPVLQRVLLRFSTASGFQKGELRKCLCNLAHAYTTYLKNNLVRAITACTGAHKLLTRSRQDGQATNLKLYEGL